MITSTATIGAASAAKADTSQMNKAQLGQSEFLTLLVAQLKNQDPMNPMENADFTAQMAQFSSLEQLMSINKGLETLTTAANATNTAQAMGLIGKEIKAEGRGVHVNGGVASDIGFELPATAASVTINIENANGEIVRAIEKNSMAAGAHSVEWDGADDYGVPLDNGVYKYTVVARDAEGRVMDVSTFTRGVVDRISFENGVGYAHIGDLKYMLSEILEVAEPKQAPAPETGAAADAAAAAQSDTTLV